MNTHAQHLWSEGKGRYIFLDLYRGIIVLFMLEGHVLRALLRPDIRATSFFGFHEVIHGITAPGFLFSAGFAFAIAVHKRWNEAIVFDRRFAKRLWRAVLLILTGYMLHVPFLSLQKTLHLATQPDWNTFYSFDVLQCIGFGLLFLRLLLYILKTERAFIVSLCLITLAVVYSTPLLSQYHCGDFAPALSSALTSHTGSPFPIFPFIGFLFAGAFVSWLFLRAAQDGNEEQFMKYIFTAGGILVIAGFALDAFPLQTYRVYDYWGTSPNYFWIRLGILLLMLSGLWFFEDSIASQGKTNFRIPRWLTMLGMQSLFVYIVHLLIVYGWVINPQFNIRSWFGNAAGLGASFFIFFFLTLLVIPCAFAWRNLKKQHPVLIKGIFWWAGFCLTWSFLFHSY